jgi:Na+-transporting NADH:ubiquinone oxidoreductase subunit C
MNTNNNVYTVIYTTLIVVVVAALLAFVSQSLKGKQEANEKAETISQMLTAAQYGTKAELDKLANSDKLAKYEAEIEKAFVVDPEGNVIRELESLEVYGPKALKRQNYNIKGGANKTGEPELPVFIFKNGKTVVPIYGAGLWGPIWGYVSFDPDNATIAGAYFDHESETAGLGAKIKDDPSFQAEFVGEKPEFASANVFDIVKGGAPKGSDGKSVVDNKIDAISGATMTSQGLDAAIDTWLAAYAKYFQGNASPKKDCCGNHEDCEGGHEDGEQACEGNCEHHKEVEE